MKAFEELTRLGRIRRMRQLAQTALEAYGLADARFELLRQAGNTLFRVKARDPVPSTWNDLYEQGQYILRIHKPGYQTTTAIELELSWLAALRRDADLPVQARSDPGWTIIGTGYRAWSTRPTQLLPFALDEGPLPQKRYSATPLPGTVTPDGEAADSLQHPSGISLENQIQ